MENKKKVNIKDYIDALVDEDGLKTEVTVTLTRQTLAMTSAYLVGTAAVSTVVVLGIISLFGTKID